MRDDDQGFFARLPRESWHPGGFREPRDLALAAEASRVARGVTEAQNVPETPTPSYLPSYKGPTIGAKVKRKVSATALGSKTS